MFKDSTSKIVPNKFIHNEQTDYIWTNKIKSHIKQIQKTPLNDITNRLSSMKDSEKSQNLQILGYQPNQQDVQIINLTALTVQTAQIAQTAQTAQTASSRKIVKKEKVCKNFIEQVNCQKQAPVVGQDDKKQECIKWKLNEKKFEQNRKKIFNLDLSDSNQSQDQKQSKERKQLAKQNNQISKESSIFSEQLQILKQKKKKITQLQFQMSEQSSGDETSPKQLNQDQNRKNQPYARKVDRNFILNQFDSDSECESQRIKCENKQQQNQQLLEVIRNFNIRKLRQHFSNLKRNEEFESFHPIPQQSKISLIVKRNLEKSQYIIYDGQLICQILKVSKTITGNFKFMISTSKSQSKHIATMKSNFLGTEFHCYAKKENNKDEKYQSISITYQMNILGLNGPRKVKIYSVANPIPTSTNILDLYTKNNWKNEIVIQTYESKTPKWDSELGAFVLNLRGTAAHSSIKNCVIVDEATKNKEYLIFGKKSKDIFNLQIKHPMSILQGVAFAVSSFQRKLACQ